MKKTILGMAIMAIALVAPVAIAQNPNGNNKAKVAKEMVSKTDCKAQVACQNPQGCEFAELNLTDAQKEQLKASKQRYRAAKKDLFNKSKETAKEERDSIRKEIAKQNRELKKAHLNEIKAILTADQYVEFLENNYLNAPNDKGQRPGKIRKGPKSQKEHNGKKGSMRPNRPLNGKSAK